MKEPSVLDYLKSILKPESYKISITGHLENSEIEEKKRILKYSKEKGKKRIWKIIAGIILAIIAQSLLEPPNRQIVFAICLYFFAAILLWSELHLKEYKEEDKNSIHFSLNIHNTYFGIAILFLLGSFLAFSNNTFTWLNLTLWILGIVFYLLSVWEKIKRDKKQKPSIDIWTCLFFLSIIVVIFFRVFRLDQVPAEMFSDHAEKLLDVADILNGKTRIFFPRNTGREAIQFYLTVVIIRLFNTGLSFISLKIGTALAGLLTLPYIYLIGKEIHNRWTGLLAFAIAGMAYWPNVISRVGLRFPLYPLFAAPCIYYLIKGLRTSQRNYFVLSGIALGIGMHGYSPMRIVPLVIAFGVILALLKSSNKEHRLQIVWSFILLLFTAFVFFLPIFHYMLENPTSFSIRAFSRITSIEKSLQGPAWLIFISNLWNAITMFFYSDGEIWVHSIPGRPALDFISAAFLFIGLIYMVKRYIKNKDWLDFFILICIPLLMLPSILSLAFPRENPSLNRTAAAIMPIFIIIALGWETMIRTIFTSLSKKWMKFVFTAIFVALFLWSGLTNFNLVFKTYDQQFKANAWNSSEIGSVIRNFINTDGGNPNNAYVVPYPYWVDTRLVGINAGFPQKDYALWPDQFITTTSSEGQKLFILKPEDAESKELLRNFYPWITEERFISKQPGKDFIILKVQ